MDKKALKKFINTHGFFNSFEVKVEKNIPQKFENKVPQGATYFEGIASTGELNRNGYIIRESAWKNAIKGYMENPVILLGHDTDEPIGLGLGAEVNEEGLKVMGFIYDDLTDGRFSKGLLNALSTGHITLAAEFENSETGEVLDEKEFRNLDFEEQFFGPWVMAILELEWVEFSLVSIGSNRKSMVTTKNAIEAFMKFGKLSQVAVNSIIENESDAEGKAKEETEAKKGSEKEGEKPEPKSAEKAEEEESEAEETEEEDAGDAEKDDDGKIIIDKKDRDKLKAARDKLQKTIDATEDRVEEEDKEAEKSEDKKDDDKNKAVLPDNLKVALQGLAEVAIKQEEHIKTLEKKVSKIPVKQAEILTGQFNGVDVTKEKPKSNGGALTQMFRDAGLVE